MRTLRIMDRVFRQGMLEELQLDPSTVHAMFPCLDQLTNIHTHFLAQLLMRRNSSLQPESSCNFTMHRLGDILLDQVIVTHPHMQYSTYIPTDQQIPHPVTQNHSQKKLRASVCCSSSSQASVQTTCRRPTLSSVVATWRPSNCTRNCWPETRGSSASSGWDGHRTDAL